MNGYRWTYCPECGAENGYTEITGRPKRCERCPYSFD